MSREEPRLAKVVDLHRWRAEKERKAAPGPESAPPPEPRPRRLSIAAGGACAVFGLALTYIPFWTLLRDTASLYSLILLFALVFPAGLGITMVGIDMLFRAVHRRSNEGWYLRRVGRRRRSPDKPGEDDPTRFGRPHKL